MAMRKRDTAVLRQLVEVQRADVNVLDDDGWGLLHRASYEGKLEFVTYLLSVPGIQVNLRSSNYGRTALHFACSSGRQAVVHELLQHPAVDVNSKDKGGNTALDLACLSGRPEVVAELLRHPGIDINQTGARSLRTACERGHASVVKELLKHPDIRVNQKDDEGQSALRCCLSEEEEEEEEDGEDGRVACLKELLRHPGTDQGEVRATLLIAQEDRRFSRYAEAILEAL